MMNVGCGADRIRLGRGVEIAEHGTPKRCSRSQLGMACASRTSSRVAHARHRPRQIVGTFTGSQVKARGGWRSDKLLNFQSRAAKRFAHIDLGMRTRGPRRL